ncbi:MAG: hypothetical protein R2826_01000 [Thermoleophilia bacterium]
MKSPETAANTQRRRRGDLVAAGLSTIAFVAVVAAFNEYMSWYSPLVLAVPVAATWLPLFLPRGARQGARLAALLLLLAVTVLGVLSVGLFFAPSAIAEGVALVRDPRK